MIPFLFVVAITVVTIWMGIAATRKSRTASDFFVAGRSVGVFMNASAISGEYLSAASFLGVAGLIMKNGYDALWYPVGYAAGYLFLLLFIAGPLRRFGAYTIPDFAEGRFDSASFRKIAVTFVLFIGFFYTMPQMKGAGLTMSSILNWPYWAGILVVGSVITFNVALGGMKGITLVQAFQYWAKLFAISVPVFVLMAVFGKTTPLAATEVGGSTTPAAQAGTKVKVKGRDAYPANVLTFSSGHVTRFQVPSGTVIDKVTPSRAPLPEEDPILPSYLLNAQVSGAGSTSLEDSMARMVELSRQMGEGASIVAPADTVFRAMPVLVTKGGQPVMKDGKPVTTTAKVEFGTPTEVTLIGSSPAGPMSLDEVKSYSESPSGGPVAPNAPPDGKWLNPFGPLTSKHGYPLLYTYSLIIALVCGTAGLPHILVRFYTNPDGRAAKRTTLWVMVLLGLFYVFTPIWGALGRAVMPQLYASNATDSVLIRLPTMLKSEMLGQILSGITSAGAFAAFMSTFSGLLVSMSGAFAHDIYGRILKPSSTPHQRLVAFKVAAVVVGAVSMGLGLLVESFDIAMMVGWAFAIGAASYFPLLLLGSWWRGLTRTGAAAGMLLGGLLSLSAIVVYMLLDKKVIASDVSPLAKSLMEQPAIWGVPLALATMWLVSLATASQVPKDVTMKMLRLHAPEETGLQKDYIAH
ncbi:MAG TPA: cation acetate symporter [Fimbriimonas sp.]